jgi:hypothetical protein
MFCVRFQAATPVAGKTNTRVAVSLAEVTEVQGVSRYGLEVLLALFSLVRFSAAALVSFFSPVLSCLD